MANRHIALSALVVMTGSLILAAPLRAATAVSSESGAIHAEADVPPAMAFAWRIASGVWDGVALDGLTVAAVVPGTTQAFTAETGAVITVDLRATALQRAALVSLARELSGGRISDIARVRPSVVRFGAAHHYVEVRADEIARLTLRLRVANAG